jgi:hypothetical protein
MTIKSNKNELLAIRDNAISYDELLKLADASGKKDSGSFHEHCPKCGADPSKHEVRNYSMMWHEGDVYCLMCNTFVRSFDAG